MYSGLSGGLPDRCETDDGVARAFKPAPADPTLWGLCISRRSQRGPNRLFLALDR